MIRLKEDDVWEIRLAWELVFEGLLQVYTKSVHCLSNGKTVLISFLRIVGNSLSIQQRSLQRMMSICQFFRTWPTCKNLCLRHMKGTLAKARRMLVEGGVRATRLLCIQVRELCSMLGKAARKRKQASKQNRINTAFKASRQICEGVKQVEICAHTQDFLQFSAMLRQILHNEMRPALVQAPFQCDFAPVRCSGLLGLLSPSAAARQGTRVSPLPATCA